MIKNNFLYNVRNKVRWDDDTIENVDLLVEANNETVAEEIASERLMDRNHWRVKEIMWQELTTSKYYLTKDDKCEDGCCAYDGKHMKEDAKLEDFIKYAKEVYDIDITEVPSDEPDTFDTFFGTIEPKHKYVIVYGDASTDVIESNGYPNIAQLHNVVAIVKCE